MINTFEVKAVWSDYLDLEKYSPDDVYDIGLWINFKVGLVGVEGANDFQVFICTPNHLKKMVLNSLLWARHFLIIEKYTFQEIKNELDILVGNYNSLSVHEAMRKIGRYAAWEYEDYVQKTD